MNAFEQAEAALREFAKLSVEEQHVKKVEIVQAFEIYWRSNPRCLAFGEVCARLVLFPEMMWTMVKTG